MSFMQHHLLNVIEYEYGDYTIRNRNGCWYWHPKGKENGSHKCETVETCIAEIEVHEDGLRPCEAPVAETLMLYPSITDSPAYKQFEDARAMFPPEHNVSRVFTSILDMMLVLEQRLNEQLERP